jgi:hypothetical protein
MKLFLSEENIRFYWIVFLSRFFLIIWDLSLKQVLKAQFQTVELFFVLKTVFIRSVES